VEGIGYSVFARIVPLSVVDDLLGGTVRVAFRKMRPYTEFERKRRARKKPGNGFNGWRRNWSAMVREKPICRSVRTKPITIGNRKD